LCFARESGWESRKNFSLTKKTFFFLRSLSPAGGNEFIILFSFTGILFFLLIVVVIQSKLTITDLNITESIYSKQFSGGGEDSPTTKIIPFAITEVFALTEFYYFSVLTSSDCSRTCSRCSSAPNGSFPSSLQIATFLLSFVFYNSDTFWAPNFGDKKCFWRQIFHFGAKKSSFWTFFLV